MTGPAAPERLSAAEIAAEIANTRARLSHGLARLDRDYALRHLLVRGRRLVAGEDGGEMVETVKRNALPLALVGLGLAWLGVAGRKGGAELAGRLAGALAELQGMAQVLRLVTVKEPPPAPPAGGG